MAQHLSVENDNENNYMNSCIPLLANHNQLKRPQLHTIQTSCTKFQGQNRVKPFKSIAMKVAKEAAAARNPNAGSQNSPAQVTARSLPHFNSSELRSNQP